MFKLGFFSPENTTNRYLGIFFAFSENTVIWVANRDKPLADSSGAVRISRDGNLVLINGRNETVWSTNIAAAASPTNMNMSSVQILDTGNLVLQNLATRDTIWDSFSHITDVLLPGMTLTYNTRTGEQGFLSSWKNSSDPAVGSFTAGIEALNTLQLVIRNQGRLYWRSGPWNGMLFLGIKEMFYSYLDGFNHVRNDTAGNFYYRIPEPKYLVKVSLNSSGNSLRMHWNNQTKSWDTVWVVPENRCDVYGMCGPFGSCSVEDSPICSCLRGFEPMNRDEWERGNWSSGCRRRKQLQCGSRDDFFRLQFIKVPNFAETFYSRQEAECNSRCLGNCSCLAYAHDPTIGCMFWNDALIDIQKFTGVGVDLFLRLSASELENPKDQRLHIIIPLVLTLVCVSILVSIAWCWKAKRKDHKNPSQKVLDWTKRFSIIEGIGRGLLYLHKDSRLRIIHRDLKPSNVLLDKDWNPKISDFGMARIFGGNQDHGNTARVVGTYGYMAPEYAMEGRFSEKSDVYSFGVLILEIVKGIKNTRYYNREWSLSLLGCAWKMWSEGHGCGFVDDSIANAELEEEMVRCVQIGLLCVQEFPKDRPTIQTILSMLAREIIDLPAPEQPLFAEKWNSLATGSTHPETRLGFSINELTLTQLHGR
ncbi:S-locus lectin protein kinase family protein [Perilla frutescens var. hirtella]|nr:S-locus lectin protein kinase family protein [Perilla frutescens var. hirtella]